MNSAARQWGVWAFLAACVAVPLLGCVLAVHFKDVRWLLLLVPLGVFMEGGVVAAGVAWFVVAWIIG